MDPLTTNPFAALTFIAAPAILTNASSVMALGTSNRLARSTDRIRSLAEALHNKSHIPERQCQRRLEQLRYANRRALLLVRALTAFYVSLGGFAAASFTSLLGAAFFIAQHDTARQVAMLVAFACGVIGVCGLVGGSAILVWETRLTLAILADETRLVIEEVQRGAGEKGTERD